MSCQCGLWAEVNGQRENGMAKGTNLARVSESMPVEDGESYGLPNVGHGFPLYQTYGQRKLISSKVMLFLCALSRLYTSCSMVKDSEIWNQ